MKLRNPIWLGSSSAMSMKDRLFFVYTTNGSSSGSQSLYSATQILDNNWHHTLITKSGTILTLYVDGYLDIIKNTSDGTVFAPVGTEMRIGNVQIGDMLDDDGFNGDLDNVRYWDTTLSAANYNTLWNGGLGLEYAALGGLTANLISSWDFSNNVLDSTGSFDGAAFGGVTYVNDRNGNPLSAIQINANGDYVTTTTDAVFSSQNFSIEVWFKRLGNSFANIGGTFASRYNSTGNNGSWNFVLINS